MAELNGSDIYRIDDMDVVILQSLQTDGRKSFSDLSKEMGVAVSTVSKRYVNLAERGIVKIIGRVDPNKVGLIPLIKWQKPLRKCPKLVF
jgi:Lrp/AsnC family transcriptional regulator, regulator for asnA, asnC and gidA